MKHSPKSPSLVDVIEKQGLRTGPDALKASGMQSGFATQLMDVMEQTGGFTVLRAGGIPPRYNRKVSPKPGTHLTKTSNQGFFKGYLAANHRFTRIIKDKKGDKKPLGHHYKDYDRMDKGNGVFTQLKVRTDDIIRELGPGGDLKLVEYNREQGELRFQYKENHGNPQFKGDFVLRLDEAKVEPTYYAREWDKPSSNPEYEKNGKTLPLNNEEANRIISPEEWKSLYKKLENTEIPCYFTEEPGGAHLKVPPLMARHPNDNKDEPPIAIAGDWDGGGLGIPEWIPEFAKVEYNTFKDVENKENVAEFMASHKAAMMRLDGIMNALEHIQNKDLNQVIPVITEDMGNIAKLGLEQNYKDKDALIMASEMFLKCLQAKTKLEVKLAGKCTDTQQKILDVKMEDLYTDFSKQRAGCISPYEFVNNCLVNYLYKQQPAPDSLEKDTYTFAIRVGREALAKGVELDEAVITAGQAAEKFYASKQGSDSDIEALRRKQVLEHLQSHIHTQLDIDDTALSLSDFDDHTSKSEFLHSREISNAPPMGYDINVVDLYQHGYDMRNPYGPNLEGKWLMVIEGQCLFGDNQKQLLETLLADGVLEKHHFPLTFAADMSLGWDRVVEKMQELGRDIPERTLDSYNKYKEIKDINVQLSSHSIFEGLADEFAPNIDKVAMSTRLIDLMIDYPNHKQVFPDHCIEAILEHAEHQMKQDGQLNEKNMQALNQLMLNHQELLNINVTPLPRALCTQYLKQVLAEGIDIGEQKVGQDGLEASELSALESREQTFGKLLHSLRVFKENLNEFDRDQKKLNASIDIVLNRSKKLEEKKLPAKTPAAVPLSPGLDHSAGKVLDLSLSLLDEAEEKDKKQITPEGVENSRSLLSEHCPTSRDVDQEEDFSVPAAPKKAILTGFDRGVRDALSRSRSGSLASPAKSSNDEPNLRGQSNTSKPSRKNVKSLVFSSAAKEATDDLPPPIRRNTSTADSSSAKVDSEKKVDSKNKSNRLGGK